MQYKIKVRVPREVLDDSQIPLIDYDGENELSLIVLHLSEDCGTPRVRSNKKSLSAVWQGVTIGDPLGVVGMTTAILAISDYATVKIDPYTPPVRKPSRKIKKRREREFIDRLINGETSEEMGGIIEFANRPTSNPYRPR